MGRSATNPPDRADGPRLRIAGPDWRPRAQGPRLAIDRPLLAGSHPARLIPAPAGAAVAGLRGGPVQLAGHGPHLGTERRARGGGTRRSARGPAPARMAVSPRQRRLAAGQRPPARRRRTERVSERRRRPHGHRRRRPAADRGPHERAPVASHHPPIASAGAPRRHLRRQRRPPGDGGDARNRDHQRDGPDRAFRRAAAHVVALDGLDCPAVCGSALGRARPPCCETGPSCSCTPTAIAIRGRASRPPHRPAGLSCASSRRPDA